MKFHEKTLSLGFLCFFSTYCIHQIKRKLRSGSPSGVKQLETALLKELRAMLQRSQTREFKYAFYCP